MIINLDKKVVRKYLDTKESNILISNIYNDYLENFAPFIDKNTFINEYKNDYYSYFLDALEIDSYDQDFKRLAKLYDLSNFDLLDPTEFKENPYYKRIKLDKNKKYKINDLVLSYDFYNPYECFLYKNIEVDSSSFYKEINKMGYFNEAFSFLSIAKNNKTWMSITPHEINSMKEDIIKVKGKILVLGLGLGYFTFMASIKQDITNIDVIELDKDIISLFNNHLFNQFEYKNKINIINDDALSYLTNNDLSSYDYIYIDIYHNSFDALYFYLKINNILENKSFDESKVLFWIDKEIKCYIRRCLLTLIEETIYSNNNSNNTKDNDKRYKHYKNIEDKLINYLYFKLKDLTINNIEELNNLLNDESIEKLVIGYK